MRRIPYALTLLAALAGCDQPTAPAADPPSSAGLAPAGLVTPINSRIAFLSYTNEESDVYTVGPGGGGLLPGRGHALDSSEMIGNVAPGARHQSSQGDEGTASVPGRQGGRELRHGRTPW